MGYATYIGRVGGLAIALGVGVAIASAPGAALADPTDTGSSESSTSAASSSSDSSTASSSSTASDSAVSSTPSANLPQSPSTTGDKSHGPAGNQESTAGDSSGHISATDKKVPKVTGKKSGSDQSENVVVPKKPKRLSATTPSDSDTPKIASRAESGSSVQSKAEPVAVAPTVNEVSVVHIAPQPKPTTQVMPDPAPASVAPESEVTSLTATLLSSVGLAPSAGGDVPPGPGDSPLTLISLAALRRQTQQGLSGDDASALKIDESPQSSLMLASAAVNSAPTADPVVGIPNQSTGAVSVALNAVDSEGNPLIYTVTNQPANGTLKVDGAGAYTYTPLQSARLVAGTTTQPDFDSFTVSVSDGQGGVTPVTVNVPVLPAVWNTASTNQGVTGANPYGVAVVGDYAYVANAGTNTVTVINTNTRQPVGSPLVVGSTPTGVVTNGSYVFVSNRTSGTVSVIDARDPAAPKVIDVIPGTTNVDGIKVGSQPEFMAINTSDFTDSGGRLVRAGTRLYVANFYSNTVSVVDITDPTAPKVIDANPNTTTVDGIKVGANPRSVAFAMVNNQPRLYVVNRTSNTVSVVDAATNKAIDLNTATTTVDAIKVGSAPQQIAVSPDGTRAYVTNYSSNSVSIIDTTTNRAIDLNPATTTTVDGIKVPSTPIGLAISKDGSLLYVANGNDRISVIDTRTNAITNTLQIDPSPETNYHILALRQDGSLVVSDRADRAVRVVAFQRGNTPPVATADPTVGTPNSNDGAVTGLVNVKDWDGDPLGYGTVSGPAYGTVTYNAAAGTYTYIPTTTARQLAGQGTGPTSDTFTVRVTDPSFAGMDRSITVPISSLATIPATVSSINFTNPQAVGVRGNQLYVSGGTFVSVIDRTTGAVSESTTLYDSSPREVTYGTRRYVANNTNFSMKVDVIDTATGNLIDSIDVPTCFGCGYGNTLGISEMVISPDGSRLYAKHDYATETDRTSAVTIIDTSHDTVVTMKEFAELSDMEFTTNGTLYAAARLYPFVYRLDPDLNVLGTIPLTTGSSLAWTDWLGINANSTRAYVSIDEWGTPDSLSVIDLTTNTEIAATGGTTALSPDGSRRYVTQPDGKTVLVYNTATNTVIGAFATDQNPTSGDRSIAVASNGTLYIADTADNKIYVVTV